MQKLENFNILDVPKNLTSNIVDIVDTAEDGIKVEWMDRVHREIGAKRDHFVLLQEAPLLRVRLEELQQEMDDVGYRLAELDVPMVFRDSIPIPLPTVKFRF